MQLTRLAVDDSAHNKYGLLLHGWDGDQEVTAFVSRRVMDQWASPRQDVSYRTSLFRNQYNALGKSNIDAIGRIVQLKYQRGVAFNRQYPFVDVLLADIIEKRRGARHARQSAEGLSGLTYHAGKHVRLEEHAFAPQPITGEAFVRVEARTASSQFRSAKYDTNIVNAAIIQQWQP